MSDTVDWRDTVAGLVGAVCCVYCGMPFDVVKLRLQTMRGLYNGPVYCVMNMVRKEGITSLWLGATPALASACAENAVLFTSMGMWKNIFAPGGLDGDPASHSLYQLYLFGALSGVFTCLAMCPAEVVKIRLQYQVKAGKEKALSAARYRGPIHAARTIVAEEGIGSLYRGIKPLWVRDIPYNFVFMGSYESYCYALAKVSGKRNKDALNALEVFLAGGLAGMTGWAVIFPADIIKSKMQASSDNDLTMRKIATDMWRTGGIREFYHGATPCILRGFPANAALFCGVEMTMRAFKWVDGGSGRGSGSGVTEESGGSSEDQK